MVKIKKYAHEFSGYFKALNGFSIHVLAALCELSGLLLLLSLILNRFAGSFRNSLYAAGVAEHCAHTGLGLLVGGIAIALISDVIAKYDLQKGE